MFLDRKNQYCENDYATKCSHPYQITDGNFHKTRTINFIYSYKVTRSCLTLCDPMHHSPSGSLSMGFSRQEYWSGLPFPSPGELRNPGIKPGSPALQADSLPSEPPEKPRYLEFISK